MSLEVGLSSVCSHSSGLWSITKEKRFPYMYVRKCCTAYIRARSSRSVGAHRVSASFSIREAYAMGRSFPISP